jgi:hypothetical protein
MTRIGRISADFLISVLIHLNRIIRVLCKKIRENPPIPNFFKPNLGQAGTKKGENIIFSPKPYLLR